MSDTTTTERTGTTVTLLYSPEGSTEVVRQTFKGLTPDDIVAVSAALAGRRIHLPLHDADMKQLKETCHRQMRWYADRMVEALYDGMGRWYRFVPLRVRRNTVQMIMDYLREITATWVSELIAAHAETGRVHAQARALRLDRPRSAPENGPRIYCTSCSACALLDVQLPEGWMWDAEGHAHCPAHPVAGLSKEPVT